MFKPGLNGVSYGVGPVFDRKAIGLVPTQREQLLLRLCLGFPLTHSRCRVPVGLNPTSTAAIHRCRDSSQ
jgi:hypothetical protein